MAGSESNSRSTNGQVHPDNESERSLNIGESGQIYADNAVYTSKYTLLTFLPKGLREQFKRVANIYFAFIGFLMALGTYTDVFDSAVTPWTTLGPLAFVISVSLLQEGMADAARHRSDHENNMFPCTILRVYDPEGEECSNNNTSTDCGDTTPEEKTFTIPVIRLSESNDPEAANITTFIKVKMHTVKRKDIRAGDIVVCKNRDMIPVDLVLLGSSADQGSAYIETSSIDGETNLKLRNCSGWNVPVQAAGSAVETFEQAITRIVQCSVLAHPNGKPAGEMAPTSMYDFRSSSLMSQMRRMSGMMSSNQNISDTGDAMNTDKTDDKFGVLTCEAPNKSINTFNGKLTLPEQISAERGGEGEEYVTIPLNGENVLLRGAILRNTEWVIGVAAYTGSDTKLVQNSFATPSKFSRLDQLANKIIYFILLTMLIVTFCLSIAFTVTIEDSEDELWYGSLLSSDSKYYNGTAEDTKWPYLPNLDAPEWEEEPPNWFQQWLLNITLLNNFVPLSLYVTLEIVTFLLIWFINNDKKMYHKSTDTPAVARSTIVSDLGQVQYIFSDKTGTLTQNVMRFKRASVDGMVFGAPVLKAKPRSSGVNDVETSPHHPLRALLYSTTSEEVGLEGLMSTNSGDIQGTRGKLTFNAEMFLRVMSICHTVVVEKETEETTEVGKEELNDNSRGRLDTADMFDPALTGKDGAPVGHAYQAESPDEGALVTGASSMFHYQLVGRNSAGITIRARTDSIFSDENLCKQIKKGKTTAKKLACQSAIPQRQRLTSREAFSQQELESRGGSKLFEAVSDEREETWSILAVNKFDSSRKRMSILVRSPPELGSIPMLLCKGADTAMLNADVCPSVSILGSTSEVDLDQQGYDDEDDWERGAILGVQSHLGEFASEGLRTLVLGIRLLSEEDCKMFLEMYDSAASSIDDREKKLKDVANAMESNLHIVGATAIEDKLQRGVPETISNLAKAGIKLWVLTGDKRETAVEIGYSTKVLTPNMNLFVLKDEPVEKIRTKLCMEFVRLIKRGKLPQYSKAAFDNDNRDSNDSSFKATVKKILKNAFFAMKAFWQVYIRPIVTCGCKQSPLEDSSNLTTEEIITMENPKKRREAVRKKALDILKAYLVSEDGLQERRRTGRLPTAEGDLVELEVGIEGNVIDEPDVAVDESGVPTVFNRSSMAKAQIRRSLEQGRLSETHARSANIMQSTATSYIDNTHLDSVSWKSPPIVNEDELSLVSFAAKDDADFRHFDRSKRTILEKLFASDEDVRGGLLHKHLKGNGQAMEEMVNLPPEGSSNLRSNVGPRALIVEGHALLKLLNSKNGNADPVMEEILFSVASKCQAVIACRVSPAQKAELVKLVRNFVRPEPVTLAIGDGANDVGMIQEAHVGVGISGLEGQQAVNSSDFAIAQFRYLEELLLVHGRWNFIRLSKVVLFSFYKNAVLVSLLVIYSTRTLYSGTILFDQWMYAMFNFVATIPIIFTAIFDRDLERHYVKAHPEVYASGPRNEDLCTRAVLRWAFLTFVHGFMIYFMCVPALVGSAGQTSAFHGLMYGRNVVGDGEGGDLKVTGCVVFTVLVFHLAYKVLFETKSIVLGVFPPCVRCDPKRKNLPSTETYASRASWTFIGISVGSIFFFISFLYVYQEIARQVDDYSFISFAGTATHTLNTRSLSWLLIFMVPLATVGFDVALKLFSNMYYPLQSQIHMEVASLEKQGKPIPGFSVSSSLDLLEEEEES